MYRAFHVRLDPPDYFKTGSFGDHYQELVKVGESIKEEGDKVVVETLTPFLRKDGVLDGTRMRESFFPKIKADAFISHSHTDRERAYFLAGLLKCIGLEPFVDSTVWGNAADLLRLIDEHASKKDDHNYDYEKRNHTTSHVHLMLASSLSQMIDATEALFFLNTPNSIVAKEIVDTTSTPWIFHEIASLGWIQSRPPSLHRGLDKEAALRAKALNENTNFSIQHKLDLSRLAELPLSRLEEWVLSSMKKICAFPLDSLYDMIPPPKMEQLQ